MCACHCQSHLDCIPKEFSIHFEFLTDEKKHFFFQRIKRKTTFTSRDDILTLKQAQRSSRSWAECVSVLSAHLFFNTRGMGFLTCK